MNRSPFSYQSRQQEKAKLRRFLQWSVPGSLIFHSLLVVGWVFLGQLPVRVPPGADEEIELVAEPDADLTTASAISQSSGGGGGGSFHLEIGQSDPGASAKADLVATATGSVAAVSPPSPPVAADPVIVDEVQPAPSPSPTVGVTPSPAVAPVATPTPVAADHRSIGANTAAKSSRSSSSTSGLPGSNMGQGDGLGAGQGAGQGPGIGGKGSRGGGVGNGIGSGTGNRSGVGRDQAKPAKSGGSATLPAEPPVPLIKPPSAPATTRQRPKCVNNCDKPDFFGKEGSTQFDFDIDARGNPVNLRLKQSSGDPEVDRQAAETIRRRRYESSDEGYQGAKLRVTYEQEGSDFQRQQEQRRREPVATSDQQERDRQLAQPQQRDRELTPPATAIDQPVDRSTPLPVVTPVAEPIAPATPLPAPTPDAPTPAPPPPTQVEPAPAAAPVEPPPAAAPPPAPIAPPPVAPSPTAAPATTSPAPEALP